MRILIVEDEPSSQHLLKAYLTPYGDCEVAGDGEACLAAVRGAFAERRPFDLICLDIRLPGSWDGMGLLREIRRIEDADGLLPGDGAKIMMTTALAEKERIIEAFRDQCEAYLVKPIEKAQIVEQMRKLHIIN